MRVVVKAVPVAGFRCAGSFWPSSETEAELDAEAVAKLKASPHLIVVDLGAARPHVETVARHAEAVESHKTRKGK
jgi:hypothetical protein